MHHAARERVIRYCVKHHLYCARAPPANKWSIYLPPSPYRGRNAVNMM